MKLSLQKFRSPPGVLPLRRQFTLGRWKYCVPYFSQWSRTNMLSMLAIKAHHFATATNYGSGSVLQSTPQPVSRTPLRQSLLSSGRNYEFALPAFPPPANQCKTVVCNDLPPASGSNLSHDRDRDIHAAMQIKKHFCSQETALKKTRS